jgi:hypothetical protein
MAALAPWTVGPCSLISASPDADISILYQDRTNAVMAS